ncbi:MAG: hypothetical protein ACXVB0_16325 [Mucilaginibacter sp.]
MNKNIPAILVLFLISFFAKAQSGNKISISIGPELGIPLNTNNSSYGNVRYFYQDGNGGSVKVEWPVTSALHLTGAAGFAYYPTNAHYLYVYPVAAASPFASTNGVLPQPPPYKFIPVKAGLQYYYDKCLYLSGEAGGAIKANSASMNSFIYSAGLGAVIPFDPHNGLDIGIRYERGFEITDYPSPMSQVAFRLAYKYSF